MTFGYFLLANFRISWSSSCEVLDLCTGSESCVASMIGVFFLFIVFCLKYKSNLQLYL